MTNLGRKILFFFLICILLAVCPAAVTRADTSLSNGYYILQSGVGNFKAMDVKGASKAEGASILLRTENGTESQQFRILRTGEAYKILNVNSDKAVGTAGGKTANGTDIQQSDYTGAGTQQWRFEDAGNGWYYIINVKSGKALEAAGGGSTNGTNVQLNRFNGKDEQKWKPLRIFVTNIDPSLNIRELKATEEYNNKITLSWTKVKGAKKYEVYRNSEKIATVTGTTYKDKNLTAKAKYQYKVRACSDSARGAFSYKLAMARYRNPRILLIGRGTNGSNVKTWFTEIGCTVVRSDGKTVPDPAGFDALVIPGGGDVTPGMYGEEMESQTSGCDLALDQAQVEAVKRFLSAGKPVFGICRGAQIINVALGGTLVQDIERHQGWRSVRIDQDSVLGKAFGTWESVVHSHHQCVKKLGKGLKAVGWDVKTDVIEAIEHRTKPVYGVQFHPERQGTAGNRLRNTWKKIILENMAK